MEKYGRWNGQFLVWNGKFCLLWNMEDLRSIPQYALLVAGDRSDALERY